MMVNQDSLMILFVEIIKYQSNHRCWTNCDKVHVNFTQSLLTMLPSLIRLVNTNSINIPLTYVSCFGILNY